MLEAFDFKRGYKGEITDNVPGIVVYLAKVLPIIRANIGEEAGTRKIFILQFPAFDPESVQDRRNKCVGL